MTKTLAALALVAVVFATACHKEPASIRVVMKNDTKQHMTNFVLDYSEGMITYQIFSENYTFAENITVTSIHQMKVTYYDNAGARIEYSLDRPVAPDMTGGTLWIYFKPDSDHDMSIDFPEE